MPPKKKPKQPPLAVALTPDRSQIPIGSYATLRRSTKARGTSVRLLKGCRVLICKDDGLQVKRQGDVAVKIPGVFGSFVVALEYLEIERPTR